MKVALALGVMLLAAAWGVVTILRIYAFLRGRRRRVNFVLLRLQLLEHLAEYRRITRAERGRPGPLYVHFVAAWLLALGSAVTALGILVLM